MLTARKAKSADCHYLAKRLRKADREEIQAQGLEPLSALLMGYAVSTECYTILTPKGLPCAMFGVGPGDDKGMVGCIWMLGTDDIRQNAMSFLRQSRHWINEFHKRYPVLWNKVDARNTVHIAWLQWLGVVFIERKTNNYGYDFIEFVHV